MRVCNEFLLFVFQLSSQNILYSLSPYTLKTCANPRTSLLTPRIRTHTPIARRALIDTGTSSDFISRLRIHIRTRPFHAWVNGGLGALHSAEKRREVSWVLTHWRGRSSLGIGLGRGAGEEMTVAVRAKKAKRVAVENCILRGRGGLLDVCLSSES